MDWLTWLVGGFGVIGSVVLLFLRKAPAPTVVTVNDQAVAKEEARVDSIEAQVAKDAATGQGHEALDVVWEGLQQKK